MEITKQFNNEIGEVCFNSYSNLEFKDGPQNIQDYTIGKINEVYKLSEKQVSDYKDKGFFYGRYKEKMYPKGANEGDGKLGRYTNNYKIIIVKNTKEI